MAGILVFVEQRDGEIRKASLQAVSEAKRHSQDVTAVVAGAGIGDAAAGVGAYGANKVFVADDANLGLYSAEGYTEAVAKAAELAAPDAIFFSATAMGRDLAPRVAARLGVGAGAATPGVGLGNPVAPVAACTARAGGVGAESRHQLGHPRHVAHAVLALRHGRGAADDGRAEREQKHGGQRKSDAGRLARHRNLGSR